MFRISWFRDCCDQESRLLTPPTPGIQNSEMELFLSKLLLLCLFRDFRILDFATPGLLCWRVSTLDFSISQHPKLWNGFGSTYSNISHFAISTFFSWVASLTPPMTSIRNSEMEFTLLIFPCNYPCTTDLPCLPVFHQIKKHTLALFMHLCTISYELTLSLFFHRCILWSCHQWKAHLPINMPTKVRVVDPLLCGFP